MQKTKKKFNFLINIALLVIAILSICLFLEIILKIFYPQNLNHFKLDSVLDYKGIPNLKVKFTGREFDTIVYLNNRGLRDYNYAYNKKEKYRILVLGDSMTFGYGVENNETYSKVLENLLNYEEERYEVINAGITGYNTNQELAFLEIEGWKYSPDLVIIGFMLNDIVTNYFDNGIFDLENSKIVKKYPSYDISFEKRIRNYLSSNSHFYNFIKTKLGIKSRRTKEQETRKEPVIKTMLGIDDPIINKGWEKTSLLIDRLKETSEKQNSKLLIVIIPNKEQVDENELKEFLKDYDIASQINISKFIFVVSEYLEEKDIAYIDLLEELGNRNKNNDFYFDYDGHFNVKGHEVVAEIIYEKLKKENLI